MLELFKGEIPELDKLVVLIQNKIDSPRNTLMAEIASAAETWIGVFNRGVSAKVAAESLKRIMGVSVIVAYTGEDADLSYLYELADDTFYLGSENDSGLLYMNVDKLIEAANKKMCRFVHLGTGMLSENHEAVRAFERAGIKNIGATSDQIEIASDKIKTIHLAKRLGIPVKPGSHRELTSFDDAKEIAEKIGYPVMLKPRHGGGGRGIKKFTSSEELTKNAFEKVKVDAKKYFHDDSIYMEVFFDKIRHIEVQIMGGCDENGLYHAKPLGVRNCTIQRNHQKIIEEASPLLLSKNKLSQIENYAVSLINQIGIIGFCTVEFVVDMTDERFYFSEVNARIQVEKRPTEMIFGIDLIKIQFDLIRGSSINLVQKHIPEPNGCAIEFRINAERWKKEEKCFMSSAGIVTRFSPPAGEGIIVDTGIRNGTNINHHYDNLIALLTVKDNSREECLKKAREALLQFNVEGIDTNIPFHLWILENKKFINGNYDSDLVSEVMEEAYQFKRREKITEKQFDCSYEA